MPNRVPFAALSVMVLVAGCKKETETKTVEVPGESKTEIRYTDCTGDDANLDFCKGKTGAGGEEGGTAEEGAGQDTAGDTGGGDTTPESTDVALTGTLALNTGVSGTGSLAVGLWKPKSFM